MAGFSLSSLSSDWQARFADVNLFNDYAKDHQVNLGEVEIKDYDLKGMVMLNGNFNGTHWKNIKAQNSHWGKVTIKGGQFEAVDFTGSQFDQVVFENVTFKNVQFDESQLTNVQFINSKINYTDFWKIKKSIILFDRSELKENDISESQANLSFKESKLFGSDFRAMKALSSLSFNNSQIEDTTLSHATLDELSIMDTKVHETAFTMGKVDKMELINSSLHFGLSGTTIKKLLITGSEMTLLAFDSAKLTEVNIQHCKKNMKLNFYQTQIKNISFDQCPLSDIHLVETVVNALTLSNSTLEDSKFMDMKAQNVTFRKVELKGTLNFTGATIENLKTEGLTKAPGLRLITEGSNVKF